MSLKKVINNTVLDVVISETGDTIPASSFIYIYPQNYVIWADAIEASAALRLKFTNGTLSVNDGATTLNAADSINYLKYPHEAWNVRFSSETERANGFYKKNVQEAIEESRAESFGNDLDSKQFGRPGAVSDAYLYTLFNVDSSSSPDTLAYNVFFRKFSFANNNNAGSFTLSLYKIDPTYTTRTLVYTENFSGYMGYTANDQDIAIDKGYGIYVRAIANTGIRPSDINVIVWMRQR